MAATTTAGARGAGGSGDGSRTDEASARLLQNAFGEHASRGLGWAADPRVAGEARAAPSIRPIEDQNPGVVVRAARVLSGGVGASGLAALALSWYVADMLGRDAFEAVETFHVKFVVAVMPWVGALAALGAGLQAAVLFGCTGSGACAKERSCLATSAVCGLAMYGLLMAVATCGMGVAAYSAAAPVVFSGSPLAFTRRAMNGEAFADSEQAGLAIGRDWARVARGAYLNCCEDDAVREDTGCWLSPIAKLAGKPPLAPLGAHPGAAAGASASADPATALCQVAPFFESTVVGVIPRLVMLSAPFLFTAGLFGLFVVGALFTILKDKSAVCAALMISGAKSKLS